MRFWLMGPDDLEKLHLQGPDLERQQRIKEFVLDLLDDLDPEVVGVLNAVFWEGLSYTNAGKRYGMSKTAVARRISRVRRLVEEKGLDAPL